MPDHAMLITGYGEEKRRGKVQKYWIARNSWGSGWGEHGYIKIARSSGEKGDRGECGIARSPSVALGGTFTKDVNLGSKLYGSTLRSRRDSSSTLYSGDSFAVRASTQIKSGCHRIRTRLGFIEEGITISTNNGSGNRNMDVMSPYALALGMFAFCLLLVQTQCKRREAQNDQRLGTMQRRLSSTEESIATSWSTIVLYGGDYENATNRNSSKIATSFNRGERVHLLENSSGARYT